MLSRQPKQQYIGRTSGNLPNEPRLERTSGVTLKNSGDSTPAETNMII